MIAGIDYGLRGAVAAVLPSAAEPRHVLKRRAVRALDFVGDLYADGRLVLGGSDFGDPVWRGAKVYVEDFMLRFANKGQREAAIRYGALLERLRWLGATVVRVPAKAWKRGMGLSADSDYGARKGAALALARRLWPAWKFTRADEADAALIAEWGARQ